MSVISADFDGDGVTDLATANYLSNNVSVLRGTGNGTFAAQSTCAVGSDPRFVFTGDFDGDGTVDLVTTNADSDNVSVLLNHRCNILLGDAGPFWERRFPAGNSPTSVAMGDFDNDGVTDLVTANGGILSGRRSSPFRRYGRL